MQGRRRAVWVAVILVIAGCGRGSITQGEAEEAWRTVSDPLQAGQERVEQRAGELGAALALREEPLTVAVDCETAGEIEFVLDVSLDDGGASSRDLAVDFTADFRTCKAQENTIFGGLQIDPPASSFPSTGGGGSGSTVDAGGREADAGGKPPEAVRYRGELVFAGDVDGPCEVDMLLVPSGGIPSEVSGTWCGKNARSVVGLF